MPFVVPTYMHDMTAVKVLVLSLRSIGGCPCGSRLNFQPRSQGRTLGTCGREPWDEIGKFPRRIE